MEKLYTVVTNRAGHGGRGTLVAMMRIVRTAFPNATMTNDRFHVQKLFYEAVDELRITYRWMARDLENDEIQRERVGQCIQ